VNILEFMAPIRELLEDESVSEVLVCPDETIYAERNGLLEKQALHFAPADLEQACKRIARALGSDISEAMPLFEGRMADGSRVSVAVPPCSVDGISVAIRKFHYYRWTMEELVHTGSITPRLAALLMMAVHDRETILISGSTGSGKTTLVSALCAAIDPRERIFQIEDVTELRLSNPHTVRMETRVRDPRVTISDLLRCALRQRPDRIIVGEVRGAEAWDLLQALNTGHKGSLSTIHANDARQALTRLQDLVAVAGVRVPHDVVARSIAAAIQLVVHLELDQETGRRRVTECCRVGGHSRDEFVVDDFAVNDDA
jgi:pilus assembly protein CpaF